MPAAGARPLEVFTDLRRRGRSTEIVGDGREKVQAREREREMSGSASSCTAAAAPLSGRMPARKNARKNALAAAAVGGRDDISNLPDGVLQHMLSFLPAQDAVRTCVLARRWRHMWKSTTSLRLVCDGTEGILEFVDNLLRLRIRGGTPLDMCQFYIDYYGFSISQINLWIRVALQCKVRVLQFICDENIDYQDISPRDGHPLFISQYLKKLELQGVNLVPSGLLDFSFCPNLEDLEIVNCFVCDSLLISSESLKRLSIINGYFSQDSRMPISICAPNLVSLWLEVSDSRSPSLQSMPSLVTAFIKIDSYDCDRIYSDFDDGYSNQSILLQALSEVQDLVLMSPDPKMFIFRRDLEFCSSFNNLKSLLIDEYWCRPADFSALARLLKLCPVLEKLTLQLDSEGPKHKVEIKLTCKPLEISAEISAHLKTLEVKCEVFDERINNVLTFLSKKLNIWFQFGG